jgi:hypothetical protein
MANSSYVLMVDPIEENAATKILKVIAQEVLGPGYRVERVVDWEKSNSALARVWSVYLPGTEVISHQRALQQRKAPDEPYGFMVFLSKDLKQWEFRHPWNPWERWAQNRIQQLIARHFGLTTYRDEGTESPMPVDPDALKATFKEYLVFRSGGDLPDVFKHELSTAPEGFRD